MTEAVCVSLHKEKECCHTHMWDMHVVYLCVCVSLNQEKGALMVKYIYIYIEEVIYALVIGKKEGNRKIY